MTSKALNEMTLIGALGVAYKAHRKERKDLWPFHFCDDLCMVDIARRQKRLLDAEPTR